MFSFQQVAFLDWKYPTKNIFISFTCDSFIRWIALYTRCSPFGFNLWTKLLFSSSKGSDIKLGLYNLFCTNNRRLYVLCSIWELLPILEDININSNMKSSLQLNMKPNTPSCIRDWENKYDVYQGILPRESVCEAYSLYDIYFWGLKFEEFRLSASSLHKSECQPGAETSARMCSGYGNMAINMTFLCLCPTLQTRRKMSAWKSMQYTIYSEAERQCGSKD